MQARKRKWVGYTAGETLFGLPVTAFPELERTELEIVNLDKLYRWGSIVCLGTQCRCRVF